jgi:asparagine synthase (glutamine-hydrolysing)
MDEPFHSPSVFGHWKVMQLARSAGVTVLLDGQGGDEVFGGYHHLYPAYLLDFARRGRLIRGAAELGWRRRVHGYPARSSLADVAKLLAPQRLRGRHVPPWLSRAIDIPRRPFPHRTLEAHRRHDLGTAPLPAYLHHVDRNSMSFSLEARVPFLDYRVVETALSLPGEALLRRGLTKWSLREAMLPLLPPEVVRRRDKQGFTVDHQSWLAGSLGGALRETYRSDRMASRPYFDGSALTQALECGSADEVWRSYVVERWLRLFVDPSTLSPAPVPGARAFARPPALMPG